MIPVESMTLKGGEGIEGDTSYGRKTRQVLLVSKETIEAFDLAPGNLRENIVTTRLDLQALQSGSLLSIGETTIEVTGDCSPCDHLETLRVGLKEEIRGNRGILARVVTSGVIQIGHVIAENPA